jgi:hypothetical protein
MKLFRGAPLAVRSDGLRFARFALAIRHEAVLRGSGERLALFRDRFA